MQGDKDALNFSKSLKKNKKLGWYKEPFIFPKTPEISRNSNGEPAAKKPKQNASPTNFFVRTVQFYKSLSHNYSTRPHPKNIRMIRIAFTFMFRKRIFSIGETKRT